MRFSVIVPVFNTSPHLPACIAALQALEYPRAEFEILMVDNNSTDGSAGILATAKGIRALTETTQGSYAARNRAVREARGTLLAFTDSDCMPDRDWLQRLDAAFENPQVQIVLGSRRPAVNTGIVRLLSDYEAQKEKLVYSSSTPEVYYGFTNNMGVRRSLYDRYGPFVERSRGADTIFVRRVVDGEGCAVVLHDPSVVVEHAEMDGVLPYFAKTFTYGRSRRLYRHIVKARPLTGQERLKAFQACRRDGRYSLRQAGVLLTVLTVGLIAWIAGSIVGSWQRAR